MGTAPDSDIRPVSSASDTVSAASPLIAAIRERQPSHTDSVVSVSSPVDTAPKTDTENELTDLEDLLLPKQISAPTTVEAVKSKKKDPGQQVVPEKKDPQVKNESGLSDAVTPRKEGDLEQPDLKSPEVIGRLNRLKKKLKKQKMQQQAMAGMPVMSERLQAKLLGKQATQTIVEKKKVKKKKSQPEQATVKNENLVKRTDSEISVSVKKSKSGIIYQTLSNLPPVNVLPVKKRASSSSSSASTIIESMPPVLSERLQTKLLVQESASATEVKQSASGTYEKCDQHPKTEKTEKQLKTEADVDIIKNGIVRRIAKPRKAKVRYVADQSCLVTVAGKGLVVMSSPEPWVPAVDNKVERKATPPKLELEKRQDAAEMSDKILESESVKCDVKSAERDYLSVDANETGEESRNTRIVTNEEIFKKSDRAKSKSSKDSKELAKHDDLVKVCADKTKKDHRQEQTAPQCSDIGKLQTGNKDSKEVTQTVTEPQKSEKSVENKQKSDNGGVDEEQGKTDDNLHAKPDVSQLANTIQTAEAFSPVVSSADRSLTVERRVLITSQNTKPSHAEAAESKIAPTTETLTKSKSTMLQHKSRDVDIKLSVIPGPTKDPAVPSVDFENVIDAPPPAAEVEVSAETDNKSLPTATGEEGVTVLATVGEYHTKLHTVGHMYGLTSESPVRPPSADDSVNKSPSVASVASSVSCDLSTSNDVKMSPSVVSVETSKSQSVVSDMSTSVDTKPTPDVTPGGSVGSKQATVINKEKSKPSGLLEKKVEKEKQKHTKPTDVSLESRKQGVHRSDSKPFLGPKSKKLEKIGVQELELMTPDASPVKSLPPVSPQSKICKVNLIPVPRKTVRRLMRDQGLETPEQRLERKKLKKALKKKKEMEKEAARLASKIKSKSAAGSKIKSKAIIESNSDSDGDTLKDESNSVGESAQKLAGKPVVDKSGSQKLKIEKTEPSELSKAAKSEPTDISTSPSVEKQKKDKKKKRHHSEESTKSQTKYNPKQEEHTIKKRHHSAGSLAASIEKSSGESWKKHSSAGAVMTGGSGGDKQRRTPGSSVQEIDMFASIRDKMDDRSPEDDLKTKKKKHKELKPQHRSSGKFVFQ